jgi:hypothetical protein
MPRGKQWIWFVVFGLIGVAIIVGIASGGGNDHSPAQAKRTIAIPTTLQGSLQATVTAAGDAAQTASAANAAANGPKLALISASCTTDASIGYITCEGFVQNISANAIKHVTAVAVFTDTAGTPLSSDDALVSYDPLLPAQQSPFKVLTRLNPAFTNWRIEFKELLGGQIKTRDDTH